MSSSSSSDEFEDAEDGLGPLPDITHSSLQPFNVVTPHRETASVLHVSRAYNESIERRIELGGVQPSTSLHVNMISPSSLSPQLGKPDISSASRRGRLNILRGRMRSEFGGSGVGGNMVSGSVEDETGSASESASLASWGRNLLMEHSALSVGPFFPADSMSTKAFSATSSTHEHSHTVGMLASETLSPLQQRVSESNALPTSPPPPSEPPPPLPLSPCSNSVNNVRIPPPNSVPPPLPPRKPALRLPAALPSQQIASIIPESAKPASATQSPISDNEQQTMQNDSILSMNSYARRRGHAKTNSLDRGLSLAKSMKTGPFPPPSNKSNSLKRECSAEANDVNSFLSLDGGEEDLRNSDAQGIIHQITSSILNDEPLKEESSSSDSPSRLANNGRLSAVGEEQLNAPPASLSASPISVNLESKIETLAPPPPPPPPPPQEAKKVEVENLKSADICVGDITVVEATKDATLMKETMRDEETHLRHAQCIPPQAFVDPITRDVERRMSMKGHQQAAAKGGEEDGLTSPSPSASGGVERAAIFVREYGSFASGLFRGAISRARSIVSSRMFCSGAASRLPKEEEESCNESDKEEAMVDSIPIVRPKSAKKGPFDFDGTRLVQELNNEHTGAVWCMKFSLCGRLLATAGQDNIIRVWVLRNHLTYFNMMRERYNAHSKKTSAISMGENLLQKAMQEIENDFRSSSTTLGESLESSECRDEESGAENCLVMAPKPLCTYRGHTADVLDLSWSRSYFILSSGMDRTVKLWHLSRPECLCCFQHMDFVTCIAFMPKDDRYFLSGSLDGKLRLWHIPDKKVALWNEVEQVKFITAIAFVKNGRFAVVGTYDGRCFFYTTDQLKYHTVIDVRSSRGKNARGHKVTGLAVHGDKLLVTSNDSRIRMYDLRDMALTCKFKGAQNERSQIRASFSPDGKHIVCGSEDRYVYVWTTADLPSSLAVRKDRNDSWQRIRCHSACVSAAIFAPRPQLFLSLLEQRRGGTEERRYEQPVVHLKNAQERQLHGDMLVLGRFLHLMGRLRFSRMLSSKGAPSELSAEHVVPLEAVNEESAQESSSLASVEVDTLSVDAMLDSVIEKQAYSKEALSKLKLDVYPFYVEREWWKEGKRMTFWSTWRMLRDVKRRRVLAELGPDRMRLKALKSNTILPQAIRDECAERLHNMDRYSRPNLILNMCQFTGRRHGKIKPYRVNRHIFRRLADHGQLSGVQRAMW
uniref:WD repeat-containing protein 44 n=2 Tax=Parascaris univalens TaxID=6257 RepID=A0A915B102_PARUN